MIIDEAHRASTMMYDVLFKEANYLTNNKLFSVCGLSATPGRNTIISENEVDKLVNRFQMNLITPEFKDNSKYKENPLEYFKEYKYLSKVNHIVFKSNIEYKLTEKELKDLEDKKEYSPSFFKKIALNTSGRRSAYIDSNTNKMERRIIIKQFTEGNIEFLFNYGVLTTGFDAPKTRNIVICRPINSDILYEQIVGRGIRGTRFGGTEECDVIDFSDNIYHLGKQQTYMRFKDYWDKENHE